MPHERFRTAWRLGALAVLAGIPLLFACTTTEGERCNASLSHDECGAGLTCTVPANCGYAVCCRSGVSTTPACAACADPDAGAEVPDATADAPADAAATNDR